MQHRSNRARRRYDLRPGLRLPGADALLNKLGHMRRCFGNRTSAWDIEHLRTRAAATPERIVACVCTRDRPQALARCLSALTSQEVPAGCSLTIVVVDNSAAGGERDHVRGLSDARIVYLHEPAAGIPIARNAAIDAALALDPRWIAFIDDDCVPARGWLARLLELARDGDADVLQGSLARYSPDRETDVAARSVADRPLPARPCHTAATNNVLLRSWIVAEPLSLRFDIGMRDSGGSDGEFFMRAADLGARIMRTDDAPVFEAWAPERQGAGYLCMRAFRVGTNCNYRYRKNRRPGIWAAALILGRAGERFGRWALRTLHSMVLSPFDFRRARDVAWTGVLDLCFAWGCVAPYFGIKAKKYY